MRVLTCPDELESLPLPKPALLELRRQLIIPGQNLRKLWRDLPARLIYLDDDDPTAMLIMAMLAQLPPPEFEVPIDEYLWLRLHIISDDGAGIYFLYPNQKGGSNHEQR